MPSPVNTEYRPRRVRRRIAEQVHHRLRDFVGGTDTRDGAGQVESSFLDLHRFLEEGSLD
jgi:hypothetical protein